MEERIGLRYKTDYVHPKYVLILIVVEERIGLGSELVIRDEYTKVLILIVVEERIGCTITNN